MGFLSNLLIGGAGSGAKDVMEGVGSLAKDLRSAITGELPADKRAELEAKVLEIELKAMALQSQINLKEAESPNLFIAGWRPFIGWVGGLALAYHFLMAPYLAWITTIYYPDVTLPQVDITTLYPIVLAMLGIGTMRSYEKSKDLHGKH